MKVTNKQLYRSFQALSALSGTRTNSIQGMFLVGRVKRLAEEALKDYAEAQKKLVDQFGARDTDGELIQVNAKGENIAAGEMPTGMFKLGDEQGFQVEIDKLFAIEVPIDVEQIKLSELGTFIGGTVDPETKKERSVTGDDLAALYWLIVPD